MEFFIKRLLEIRTSKNISQIDISKSINISLRSYQRYEKGEREPSLTVIYSIADYFDVSTDYLLGRNPQNPPTEFNNATDAMEFILKLPTVMAYGGYDATKLSDEEIIDFANDLLQQIELISYKYKKK